MYVKVHLKPWAKTVSSQVSRRELKKLVAWFYGQPVKLNGKENPPTKPGEAFEIWGKDYAKAHAVALRSVMGEVA